MQSRSRLKRLLQSDSTFPKLNKLGHILQGIETQVHYKLRSRFLYATTEQDTSFKLKKKSPGIEENLQAVSTEEITKIYLEAAAFRAPNLAIIFAALIDGLDGRIARLIKGTSKVGKELDSLTDMISFGVAPAFIMYFWKLNSLGRFGWLLCLVYVICVALRLARFNVSSEAESSWRESDEEKTKDNCENWRWRSGIIWRRNT